MHKGIIAILASLAGTGAHAAEVTIQNDSLIDFGTAVIVTGFIAGGGAGSWLTSPCDGSLRAVQVFWRSQSGTSGQVIHDSIRIYRSGTFPNPGTLAETIGGPVLTDNALNEWRFLDENNTLPLNVPVTANETIVVALHFDSAPPSVVGPSVVRDTNGIQPQRNTIFSNFGFGFEWRSAESLGVTGDWVIRGVVDCQAAGQEADVAVGLTADPAEYTPGQALNYTIVVNNAGPDAAIGTTVVDIFPGSLTGVTWTCAATGGASCVAGGSGNITQLVGLPAGGEVVFDVNGIVAPGTTAPLLNSVTAVVPGGVTDPVPGNNTASVETPRLQQADIEAVISADPTAYLPGEPLSYTVVVGNDGPSDAPGTIISDTLPDELTDVTWTCTGSGGGTCTSAGSGSIAQTVNLPAGAEVVFEITGTVAPGTTLPLTAEVEAMPDTGINDPDLDNNSDSITTLMADNADVSVDLSADPEAYVAGQPLDFTVVIANAGPSDAPNTSVSDQLPGAYTGVTWTCNGSGGGVCAAAGSGSIAQLVDLPAGAEVVFEITGTVVPGTSDPLLMQVEAQLTGGIIDPMPDNNSASLKVFESDVIFADGFDGD
jgi:uncharacterized repeat protein (TIGR01451 family)